eukprot:Seg9634.1 transcript_id=Seg9634.1/GoldUCD/mRNA.D3Y31 product="hypothetical protein" protein_id=Seg9634.1/GoldUCD/D3Y31
MEGPPRIKSCLNCKIQFLNVKGVFRCSDCGPAYLVCGECIKADHHFRPNHLPEKWTGRSWLHEPLAVYDADSPLGMPSQIHTCLSRYQRVMRLVDIQGRVHERAVEFCDCFKEPVNCTL